MGLAKIMSPDTPATTAARLANIEKRVRSIEQRLATLDVTGDAMRTLGDSAPGYSWGSGQGDAYHHKADGIGDFAPWVSNSTRLIANLTSSTTVRRTFGEAALLTASLTGLAGGLTWLFAWPVAIVPGTAVTTFALACGGLILANRGELHRLVTAQDKRSRNQELRVEVSHQGGAGAFARMDILHVAGIDGQQLVDLAPILLRTESLAINEIGGGGCILTQGQAQRLCRELEVMGFATPARGNQGRRLSAKGRALMRGLAELTGTQV